jgi:predicted membrane channel-forming protein YqfA (hemolysin III family)
MNIHEPATVLTDYLLALLAIVLAARLWRRSAPGNQPAQRWIRAFLFTAAAALLGGTYHGFAPEMSAGFARILWTATLLFISLTAAAMGLALAHELRPAARLWTRAAWVKFGLFAGLILVHPDFLIAIIDYGLVMLALAAAALVVRRSWSAPMLVAILLSAAGAAVQQLQWGISPDFNHNDLYHVIQAVALLFFYRAGRRLGRQGDRLNRADSAPAP